MQNHCVIFIELVSSMEKITFILLKLADALVSFKAMHHLVIIHTVGKTVTEFFKYVSFRFGCIMFLF